MTRSDLGPQEGPVSGSSSIRVSGEDVEADARGSQDTVTERLISRCSNVNVWARKHGTKYLSRTLGY
ncbi:MAG: hypothetical protein V3T64_07350 [Myxococcota bacterium]